VSQTSTIDAAARPVSFRPGELAVEGDGTGYLIGSRCRSCGAHYFPKRELCARCLTEDVETVPLSRRGTLYTFTIVRQSTPEFAVPYVLGYVDLPEKLRVMGQIAGCDPEDVHIGMPVELSLEPWGEDDAGRQLVGYRFRPVNDDEE